jgi:hypothetical protein
MRMKGKKREKKVLTKRVTKKEVMKRQQVIKMKELSLNLKTDIETSKNKRDIRKY